MIDTEGKVLASTFPEADAYTGSVLAFIDSPADSQVIQGFQFFKIFDDNQLEYILLLNGGSEDAYMIGKLVVHGDTRDQAIRKMKTALGELVIEGISHNAELQMELMGDPRFVDGTYTTGLMAQREKERKA